ASTGRVFVARTRWARSRDATLLVRGEPGQARHTHGGAPARIGHATFVVHNRGPRPRRLTLRGARWNSSPGQSLDLPVARLLWRPVRAGAAEVEYTKASPGGLELPARSTAELLVGFPFQPAYQAWNNRFWVDLVLEVAGPAGPEVLRPAAEI